MMNKSGQGGIADTLTDVSQAAPLMLFLSLKGWGGAGGEALVLDM